MTELEARSLVVAMGRRLLEEGLVVRTWGNISCKLDDDSFVITPSGLDYMQTTKEDLVIYYMADGSWEGAHKPSSEKGIHAAAYEMYDDAEFVIHTHQAYATALSVYGDEDMDVTEEELEALGGIAHADYGLPGTKILKANVRKAMETDAHIIFMEKHGTLIIGSSQEEAYERAHLLENICRRNWKGAKYLIDRRTGETRIIKRYPWQNRMIRNLRDAYPNATWVDTPAAVAWCRGGYEITAQLDDMAQMIGRTLPMVSAKDPYTMEELVFNALASGNAVLIRGFGAIVNGMDADDTVALAALVDKACITMLHTTAEEVREQLSAVDCLLMHTIYQKKYSKLK